MVNISAKRISRALSAGLATAIAVVSLAGAPLSVSFAQSPAAPATPAAPAANAAPTVATPAAAPVAAPAPAPFQSGKPAVEKTDNPYGLKALWNEGDIIAKTTLVILVIMSVATWYIMVAKFFELSKLGRQARAAENSFWSAPTVAQGVESLKEQSPFRFIAEAGLESTKKHQGLLAHISFSDWTAQFEQFAEKPGFDWPAFHRVGFKLSKRLKQELGPSYRVSYHKPCEDPRRNVEECTEIPSDAQ